MLVSTDAAAELGIYQSDVTRIKVRLLTNSPASATSQFDDLAYNPDPDINPAAALKTPEELVVAGETDRITSYNVCYTKLLRYSSSSTRVIR